MYRFAQCQYHIAIFALLFCRSIFSFLRLFLIFFSPMQLHTPQPTRDMWSQTTEREAREREARVNFGGQIPNSIEILSFSSFFCCYWSHRPTILWLYFSNYTSLPFVVPAWNCHFPTFLLIVRCIFLNESSRYEHHFIGSSIHRWNTIQHTTNRNILPVNEFAIFVGTSIDSYTIFIICA